MRRSDVALPAPMDTGRGIAARSDWGTRRKLLPYLWRYLSIKPGDAAVWPRCR